MTDDTDLFYLKFICQVRQWAVFLTQISQITQIFLSRCATADFADFLNANATNVFLKHKSHELAVNFRKFSNS